MIRTDQLHLAPGGEDLLSEVSFHLRSGEKVGLVGRNGSGKTTLLRALAGELLPDRGAIHVRSRARIGWLPQQAVSGSTLPVWDEARSRMDRLEALERRLKQAEAAVSDGVEGSTERLDDALEAFRQAGGFRREEHIGEVLHGLGFGPDDWHRPCDTFSGGWQMRIALARLLLSEPDVALLDEPTNHLDLNSRTWLAHYLARSPHSLVVVSHDRYLLDRVVERIAEVRGGRLHTYSGNYGRFLTERTQRIAQAQTEYERQQEEISKLEGFVERFGAKATKAAQARSRQRRLDKMERLEAPAPMDKRAQFRLPEAPDGASEVLILRGAAVGWPENPLLREIDLTLTRGMRVAVVGPNGCGKSTFLHSLGGRRPLLGGRRHLGDRVRIGMFTQDLAADLPGDRTALDYVTSQVPLTPPQRIRAVLGALGLSGDAALRPIGELSGGEKARVALASLAVRPSNVLLLDEPTNHLDVETIDVLVDALRAFDGCLVVVTHDRHVVESVATHVIRIENDTLDLHEGVRPEDLEPVKASSKTQVETPKGALDHAARKQLQRERERAHRRGEAIQLEVEQLEARLEELDAALYAAATDYVRSTELAAEREATSLTIEDRFTEWEQLEAHISELDDVLAE